MHGVSIFDSRARFIWNSHLPHEFRGSVRLLGRHPWEFVLDRERSIVEQAFCRAAFGGEPSEYRVTSTAGTVYQVELEPLPSGFVTRWRDLPEKGVKLTPREREVLVGICNEDTTHRIARRLGVSDRTVETFRRHVREKIGVHTPIGIFRWAVRMGIVEA